MKPKAFRKNHLTFPATAEGKPDLSAPTEHKSINEAKRFSRTVLGLMQVRRIK